jgi:hypothetical protein
VSSAPCRASRSRPLGSSSRPDLIR